MPEEEERLWQMDVLMNAYGVRVDTDLIEGALYIDQISTQRLTDEAISLTAESKQRGSAASVAAG